MYAPAEDPDIRVIEPLGQGGTATVVKAFHSRLKRAVALKYPLPDSGEESGQFAQLARREFDLTGRYRFPGFVRPLADPGPNHNYLALELCPGPTLAEIDPPGDTATALNIISAIAANLEFLRAVGLVHGDLKPQNVFLPSDWQSLPPDHLFFVKLSDFSLGRLSGESDDERLGLGTVGYMAPETIIRRETSHQSDLFALGVIAYQLFTGRHPFMEDDAEPVKVNSRIREQEPVLLAKLRPDLPSTATDVLTSLLAKDKKARPFSGWEVCRALEKAGAAYPFRKVLRPTFMYRDSQSFEEFATNFLRLQVRDRKRLAQIADEDPSKLRLILSANFRRGGLAYDDGQYCATAHLYWPHRLRQSTIRQFTAQPMAVKKAAVTISIIGGVEAARRLQIDETDRASHLPSSLMPLLLTLLRSNTVKQVAAHYAPIADHAGEHNLAAELHLKAGNLSEAERCADLAARAFNNDNANDSAIALLRRVELVAGTAGREFEIRRLIMLRGNTHKESGELDAAQLAYDRIVELYENRPPDKLLAETYKYLGDLYRLRQDSRTALKILEKSLKVFTELGDELEISHTLTNIGNVHWIASDTRQALASYRAAYRMQIRLDAKPDIASTLHNIATMFCLDGRLKRGTFLLNHALQLKKEIGHAGEIARTLNNLGYVYQLAGDPAGAVGYITESLEINRRIGSRKEVLYNLENLVELKIAAGQLKESVDLLKEGLALASELNLTAHEGPFHLYTAIIAKRLGNYSEAVRALTKVDQILQQLDDYSLGLLAEVQKASLRYQLGDSSTALKIAKEAYESARESKNSVAELDSLLLLTRITDEPGYRDASLSIVRERRLVREKRLLDFGHLEYLLENDRARDAIAAADNLVDQLDRVEQDLELPRMHNLAARLLIEQGDPANATRHLEKARQIAQAAGLLPELITTLSLRGKLAKSDGEYEEAFGYFRQALEIGRKVANSIESETDRRLFGQKPVLRLLASEINELGKKLGQKQRAGG